MHKRGSGINRGGGEGQRLKEERKTTLIKNKIKFSSYIRIFRVIGCKVIYANDFLIYGEIFAHFLIY
jgi:hypothetical protein